MDDRLEWFYRFFGAREVPGVEMLFGVELEWGDVDRRMNVPDLMKWATAEIHVVNSRAPYRGVAMDPDGIDPPFGGEVNMRPSKTPLGGAQSVATLRRIFTEAGCAPTATLVGGTHVHVSSNLLDNLDVWKNLAVLAATEHDRIASITAIRPLGMEAVMNERAAQTLWGHTHLNARVPQWLADNLLKVNTKEEFLRVLDCGRDGVSRIPMPGRKLVNLRSLGSPMRTVEFRSFASTESPHEVLSAAIFAQRFVLAAAGLFSGNLYEDLVFPTCIFEEELYRGWVATKKPSPGSRSSAKHARTSMKPIGE